MRFKNEVEFSDQTDLSENDLDVFSKRKTLDQIQKRYRVTPTDTIPNFDSI